MGNSPPRSGHGICTYDDGRIYNGNWANDFPSGQGTMTWPDGDKYEGQWING